MTVSSKLLDERIMDLFMRVGKLLLYAQTGIVITIIFVLLEQMLIQTILFI